jgi:uroporphyrinogen decarboxylase
MFDLKRSLKTVPLLDVIEGRMPERRPIWLMRQAGRYLPEYRATREKAGSFLKLCYNPALACEVTLQPLRRFDLDAAILFSDILVVPHAMGLKLDFHEGEGPRLETVSDLQSVSRLSDGAQSDEYRRVYDTVAHVRQSLDASIGFIGFCGGPWTVASYMIEGGSSKRSHALSVAVANPEWFAELIERLVQSSIIYLLGQISAGVQVVQIFDSWAGDVPLPYRERVVIEPMRRIVDGVRAVHPRFPVIVFARGVGDAHGDVALKTGASVVGVEQGVELANVIAGLPEGVAAQGNLAPELLLESDDVVRQGINAVLKGVSMQRHIFNLGHGIVPQVKPETVTVLVNAVRSFDAEALPCGSRSITRTFSPTAASAVPRLMAVVVLPTPPF